MPPPEVSLQILVCAFPYFLMPWKFHGPSGKVSSEYMLTIISRQQLAFLIPLAQALDPPKQ